MKATYSVRNDDDPLDFTIPEPDEPVELDWFSSDDEAYPLVAALAPGESVTVGGGAAVQFTIKRLT